MITVDDMKKLEQESGISMVSLMENAGRNAAIAIKEKYSMVGKRILVACYHGNNGGDGLVAARHLSEDAEVDILFLGDESKFKEETAINFKRVEENDRIQMFENSELIDFDEYDYIIDAMLGSGIVGEVKEPIASTIEMINDSKAVVISLDISSGLNPDTGVDSDKVIRADFIITFHDLKPGHKGLEDKTVVVDIGIGK